MRVLHFGQNRLVQRSDALKRGLDFARSEQPTAAMGRHVERGSDVRFEVLEKRLDLSNNSFARSFSMRRTPLKSSPISRLSLAWPRRSRSGAQSASQTSCRSSSRARRALVAAP